MVAVDYPTNCPITHAVPDATGEAITTFLCEEIVMSFSYTEEILLDRGTNFMSKVIAYYNAKINLHHKLTSAFYPRTNDKCQRLNGALKQTLRKYVNGVIRYRSWGMPNPKTSHYGSQLFLQDKERWNVTITRQQFDIGYHVLLRHENRFRLEFN
ncbi:hypothetical protein DFQ28_011740 [Apophysomyces sp. BC1034]|nr:hypothetical protein DFQ29_007461 [Apophysomyces sp. BC1021]KAG0191492.1 hypothetical protein DFQ28_011740 [Apophysomyces sp. BC1034]